MMFPLVLAAVLAAPGSPAAASAPPSVAVIADSGSTNTSGFTLAVRRDGAAELLLPQTPLARQRVAPALVSRLYRDLARVGPLGALQAGDCMRSASFGSRLTLSYGGQTSPDLSCAASEAMRTLSADANAIVNAAHIVTRRGFPRTVVPAREPEPSSSR